MDKTVWRFQDRYKNYSESSVNTPNYWKLKCSGKRLPLHPYSAESEKGFAFNDTEPPRITAIPPSPRFDLANGFITNSAVKCEFESISRVREIVQNRLIAKLRNTEIDLGVTLGEYKETAAMFETALKRTVRAIKHVRRGNATEAYRALVGGTQDRFSDIPRFGSNAYLAFQYGVRPLIKDVQDAVKALQNRYEREPRVIEVRTRKIFPLDAKCFSTSIELGGALVRTDRKTLRGYYVGSAGLRCWVSNPTFRKLDRLGLMNPFATAWELTTLSFVVDWFLPIGQWLTNVLPPQGVDFTDGWTNVHAACQVWHERASDGYGRPDGSGWYWEVKPYRYGGDILYETKRRELLASIPRYTFIVPDISLDKTQIMSGVALLTQAVLGKG